MRGPVEGRVHRHLVARREQERRADACSRVPSQEARARVAQGSAAAQHDRLAPHRGGGRGDDLGVPREGAHTGGDARPEARGGASLRGDDRRELVRLARHAARPARAEVRRAGHGVQRVLPHPRRVHWRRLARRPCACRRRRRLHRDVQVGGVRMADGFLV